MFGIELANIFGVLSLMFVSWIFISYARKIRNDKITINSYLYSDNKLTKKEFCNTFAASITSVSFWLLFLVSQHRVYGVILFLTSIMAIWGQQISIYIIMRNKGILKHKSIADLCSHYFPDYYLSKAISLIMIVYLFCVFFIELSAGTMILDEVFRGLSWWNAKWSKLVAFFCLGTLVIGYTRYGGYKAVIQTDTWQFWMIFTSMVVLMLVALAHPSDNYGTAFVSKLFEFEMSSDVFGTVVFIAWLGLMNLLTPLYTQHNWQRMVSASSIEECYSEFKQSWWKYVVLMLFPLLAMLVFNAKGVTINTLHDLIATSKSLPFYLFIPVYSILLVGLAATMFSTADTMLIAVISGFFDKTNLRGSLINKEDDEQRAFLQNKLTIVSVIVLLAASYVYYKRIDSINSYIVNFLFFVVGLKSLIIPVVIMAIYRAVKGKKPVHFNLMSRNILYSVMYLGLLVHAELKFKIFGLVSYKYASDLFTLFCLVFISIIINFCIKISIVKKDS